MVCRILHHKKGIPGSTYQIGRNTFRVERIRLEAVVAVQGRDGVGGSTPKGETFDEIK